jgi:HAD superfamily hydrolase (TIGR01458 family)
MSTAPKLILANNKAIKAALIDISGTLHIGDEAIPGAINACRKLFQYNNRQLKVVFLTNTSKVSSETLLHQLRDMGFGESCIPDRDVIVTSVNATRQYLVTNGLRPYCLVEDDLVEKDFQGVEMNDPNCVLVGLAPSKFSYDKLNGAFRLLSKLKEEKEAAHLLEHADCGDKPSLIAIHRAKYYRDSDHQLSLGPGGFITLLEQTAGVTAHVVGKPSHAFYHAAVSSLGVDPANVVMVGDDVVGDIKGALEAGLGGAILVQTGKYVDGDELGNKTDGVLPTLTLRSIVEAVDCICSSDEKETTTAT